MSNLNEFTSLDKEEQLNILKELSDPNLSDHETEVMNYLRTHTLYETVEYFAEQKLQEYLKHSEISNTKTYVVDDYTDDELYLAHLKCNYPSFTDEELSSKLNIAKSNKTLFKKEIIFLRQDYKIKEKQEILSYLTSDSYSVDPAQLIKDIEDVKNERLKVKAKAHLYISKDSFEGKRSKCKILGFFSTNLSEIDEFLYNYPGYKMLVYLYESADTCKLLKLIDSTNTPVFKKGGKLCHY